MFSIKKNELPVCINNHIQGIYIIFNHANVSGKDMWEIEHYDVPQKIKLGFEIGLSVNETRLKGTTRNETFLKLMLILLNINGNWHQQNRCIL